MTTKENGLPMIHRDYILGGEASPDEAEEIARRCNNYDALLAGLKACQVVIEMEIQGTHFTKDLMEVNTKAKQAIANATTGVR